MAAPTPVINNSVGSADRVLVSGLMYYASGYCPHQHKQLLMETFREVLPYLTRGNPTIEALVQPLEFVFENKAAAISDQNMAGAVSMAWGDIDRAIRDYHSGNWANAWDAFQAEQKAAG